MHFHTAKLLLILVAAQIGSSAPTSSDIDMTLELAETRGTTGKGVTPNVNVLEARATDGCIGTIVGCPDAVSEIHWRITINTPYDNQADGCGRGFLDNFRGRCGVITNWGCNAVEPGRAIFMDFLTHAFCTSFDITEAMRAASGGRTVDCRQVC
jgi:hypothetical protein